MALEIHSDGTILTDEFWDCECDHRYIHPATDRECSVCHAHRDTSPDSRLGEVIEHGFHPRDLRIGLYNRCPQCHGKLQDWFCPTCKITWELNQ